ncbi:MAG: FAD-binding protein, partial [Calditrichaeota bacterium]
MAQYDYDVIVIGGGAAGLTASGVCAAFGARTALVERRRLGGDCTWYGCVPSKTLLHIAKEYTALTNLKKYGVDRGNLEIDFAKVMEAVRQTRERIYRDADAPEVMQKKGVEVISGTARFKDAHSLEIEKEGGVRTLRFRSAIITAGGSPMALNIPGLHENGFLTNESLFEINERPEHLVIMGSGPIGVEMAQAFTMLGSRVTVIALDPDILIRDERRCAAVVRKRLEEQGVRFILESTIHNVAKRNGRYDLAVGPPDAAK